MEYQTLGDKEIEDGTLLFVDRIKESYKLQVSSKTMYDHSVQQNQGNVLSIANSLGLIASAVPEGVLLLQTKDLHKYFLMELKTMTEKINLRENAITLAQNGIPTNVVFSKQNTYLAVTLNNILCIYPTKGIMKGSKPVTYEMNTDIVGLAWKNDHMVAIVSTSGVIEVLQIEEGKIQVKLKPKTQHVCCVSWSPDGDFMVLGKKTGRIEIFRSDAIDVLAFGIDLSHKTDITYINWFAPNDLLFAMEIDSLEDTFPLIVPVITSKQDMISEDEIVLCEEAVPYADDEEWPRKIFSTYLSDWKVLLISGSNYSKISVLKKNDTATWEIVQFEEKYECIAPMDEDKQTLPIGMAADLTYNSTIPNPMGDRGSQFPASPIILLLTNESLLLAFSLIDKEQSTTYASIQQPDEAYITAQPDVIPTASAKSTTLSSLLPGSDIKQPTSGFDFKLESAPSSLFDFGITSATAKEKPTITFIPPSETPKTGSFISSDNKETEFYFGQPADIKAKSAPTPLVLNFSGNTKTPSVPTPNSTTDVPFTLPNTSRSTDNVFDISATNLTLQKPEPVKLPIQKETPKPLIPQVLPPKEEISQPFKLPQHIVQSAKPVTQSTNKVQQLSTIQPIKDTPQILTPKPRRPVDDLSFLTSGSGDIEQEFAHTLQDMTKKLVHVSNWKQELYNKLQLVRDNEMKNESISEKIDRLYEENKETLKKYEKNDKNSLQRKIITCCDQFTNASAQVLNTDKLFDDLTNEHYHQVLLRKPLNPNQRAVEDHMKRIGESVRHDIEELTHLVNDQARMKARKSAVIVNPNQNSTIALIQHTLKMNMLSAVTKIEELQTLDNIYTSILKKRSNQRRSFNNASLLKSPKLLLDQSFINNSIIHTPVRKVSPSKIDSIKKTLLNRKGGTSLVKAQPRVLSLHDAFAQTPQQQQEQLLLRRKEAPEPMRYENEYTVEDGYRTPPYEQPKQSWSAAVARQSIAQPSFSEAGDDEVQEPSSILSDQSTLNISTPLFGNNKGKETWSPDIEKEEQTAKQILFPLQSFGSVKSMPSLDTYHEEPPKTNAEKKEPAKDIFKLVSHKIVENKVPTSDMTSTKSEEFKLDRSALATVHEKRLRHQQDTFASSNGGWSNQLNASISKDSEIAFKVPESDFVSGASIAPELTKFEFKETKSDKKNTDSTFGNDFTIVSKEIPPKSIKSEDKTTNISFGNSTTQEPAKSTSPFLFGLLDTKKDEPSEIDAAKVVSPKETKEKKLDFGNVSQAQKDLSFSSSTPAFDKPDFSFIKSPVQETPKTDFFKATIDKTDFFTTTQTEPAKTDSFSSAPSTSFSFATNTTTPIIEEPKQDEPPKETFSTPPFTSESKASTPFMGDFSSALKFPLVTSTDVQKTGMLSTENSFGMPSTNNEVHSFDQKSSFSGFHQSGTSLAQPTTSNTFSFGDDFANSMTDDSSSTTINAFNIQSGSSSFGSVGGSSFFEQPPEGASLLNANSGALSSTFSFGKTSGDVKFDSLLPQTSYQSTGGFLSSANSSSFDKPFETSKSGFGSGLLNMNLSGMDKTTGAAFGQTSFGSQPVEQTPALGGSGNFSSFGGFSSFSNISGSSFGQGSNGFETSSVPAFGTSTSFTQMRK